MKSYEERLAAWKSKRDAAFERVKAMALPVAWQGTETPPFQALIHEGGHLLAGQIRVWHTVKMALNKHGWPVLVPCHANGKARIATLFDGLTRRKRFGFEQVLETRAGQP